MKILEPARTRVTARPRLTKTNGKAHSNGAKRKNARSLAEHARIITACLVALDEDREQHVKRIFETGRAFQAAREELGYRGYGELFEDNSRRVRGFNEDRAGKLRTIAAKRVLSIPANLRKLPAVEVILFELSKLPDNVLQAAFDDGRIHPEMTGKDVEAIKRKLRNETHLRYRLISALETVKPAIAINQLIPLLTHYWFTGTHLMAYNGAIALQVPCRTNFRGAVPGKVLELLDCADFDGDIEVTSQDGNISINDAACNRLRIKLKMLRPDFVFEMPAAKRRRSDPQAIAELIEAIEHCLISVGRDTSTIEQLGVTLERSGKRIMLYATDGATIARASIKDRLPLAQRTILPTAFCEQMLHLYQEHLDDKAQVHFEVGEAHALFVAGEIKLYARLLQARSPLNFSGTVAHFLPPAFQQQPVDVPQRLRRALELHSLVCGESRRLMDLSVRAETLRLWSQDDDEEIDEVMPLPGHHDVAVRFEPRLLRRAVGFEKMLVAPQCVALSKASGPLYLVSASEPRSEPLARAGEQVEDQKRLRPVRAAKRRRASEHGVEHGKPSRIESQGQRGH
jgi:hypothetical protein